MSVYFVLHNVHFALEVFGALVFLVAAWLALDSFFIRRDFLTASRGIGFFSLTVWQVIHALSYGSAGAIEYVGFIAYLFGLAAILFNLVLEQPDGRPEFRAIVVLPAALIFAPYVNALAALMQFGIFSLAHKQYHSELKKPLKLFWMGFLCLAISSVLAAFYPSPVNPASFLWLAGHAFELAGFLIIMAWTWQYLQLRIREEMVLIFTSATILISILVTLAFSLILVSEIEFSTRTNLVTNARVLDFAIGRLAEEALAKARLIGGGAELARAVTQNDFVALERLASKAIIEEKLGFLTIVDASGDVLLRAHALTKRGDSLRLDYAVRGALDGKVSGTIGSGPREQVSIRAAAPLVVSKKIVGAAAVGFPLDNALVDNVKRTTGLDISIYEGKIVVATTFTGPDGRTRGTGVRESNSKVEEAVLKDGKELTISTIMFSRPMLASFLPIFSPERKVVGMISSARPQQEMLNVLTATNRLTLMSVLAVMLALALPIYVVTPRLSREMLEPINKQ